MPRFIIERDMPQVGKLNAQQLHDGSEKSCIAIRSLGPGIQWVQSFVTDNKIYCVYIAQNEDLIRKHAEMSGFPASKISQVRSVIDPTTAD